MTTALALDLGFDRPSILGGPRDDDPHRAPACQVPMAFHTTGSRSTT